MDISAGFSFKLLITKRTLEFLVLVAFMDHSCVDLQFSFITVSLATFSARKSVNFFRNANPLMHSPLVCFQSFESFEVTPTGFT